MVSCICLSSFSAFSHPHSWIDIQTKIEGNDTAITGLAMRWEFDAMTTTMTLDGEDLSDEHKEETLSNLAKELLANMLNEHYFTYFYDKDKNPIRYFEATDGHFELKRGKLILSFTLPLAEPHPYSNQPIQLMVFEPSYYTDIAWPTKKDIQLSDDVAKHCQMDLIKPSPTSEQMAYAMGLPPDADPDNALGQLFTQSVHLTCK